MRRPRSEMRWLSRALATVLAGVGVAPGAQAEVDFVLRSADGPEQGANDPTPAEPLEDNPGETLGAQRWFVVEAAARAWSEALTGKVEVVVEVSMPILPCGVLGAAQSNGYVTGREPLAADQIYSMALAERLAGESLNGDEADILLDVNTNACSDDGPQWYLGLDAAPAGLQSLFELVVHELAHGLGFESLVDPSTGVALREQTGLDPFSRRLFDLESQRYWHELSAAERARSAVRPRGVVWGGTRARKVAARWLEPGTPRIIIPEEAAGFQGWLTPPSGWVDFDTISAPLRSLYPQSPCDDDSPTSDVDALLVVGEGACSVQRLAESSARLGAVAVLEVEAGEQAPAPTFGGREQRGAPPPEIPVFRVTRRDGEVLAAMQGVEVTLANNRRQLRGADEEGRPLIYTPKTPRFGASLSHWDPLLSPSAILEPVPAPDVRHLRFELERAVLEDIGWDADSESSDRGGNRLGAASGSAAGCATSAPGMPCNVGWGCVLGLVVLLRRWRGANDSTGFQRPQLGFARTSPDEALTSGVGELPVASAHRALRRRCRR